MYRRLVLAIAAASLISGPDALKNFLAAEGGPNGGALAGLAKEVRTKGWIVFSATSAQGDWDLFLMRPDGSARRSITNTADFHEAAASLCSRRTEESFTIEFREPPSSITTRTGLLISSLRNADGSNPSDFREGLSMGILGAKRRDAFLSLQKWNSDCRRLHKENRSHT